MTYAQAIQRATKDPEFAKTYNRFREQVTNNQAAGSIQFHIGDEAFYYAGENVYDETTSKRTPTFHGGKHSPRRAAYLISRGQSYEIR